MNASTLGKACLFMVLGTKYLFHVNLSEYHAFQESYEGRLDANTSVTFVGVNNFLGSFTQKYHSSCRQGIICFLVES